MKKMTLCLAILGLLTMTKAFATNSQSWKDWLAGVHKEALEQGIPESLFEEAFADVREPSKSVKGLARSQPEKRLTFVKYLNSRVDQGRINAGLRAYHKNQALADEVAQNFGVDPCFIMSFWGLETSYGGYMGTFPVVKSLATLAYDSNRPEFFRHELFLALHILNDGHVSFDKFKGEWAGASGHPQFLPSSWVSYAVDYDGDGRKDIWTSKADAFASIANYMKQNGWKTGQPWAIYVKLPPKFDMSLQGKTITKKVSEWDALGVKTESGEALPYQDLEASIIQPEGGPVFLAFSNYKMILKYNNSIYYAGAIGYLADKICQRQT